jgi:hypothetical protein
MTVFVQQDRLLGIVSTMGSFRERTTDGRSKLDASRR